VETVSEQKPNKNANLKPWKPGQSGNPAGRPSWKLLTDHLRADMNHKVPLQVSDTLKIPKGSTWGAAIARRLCIEASAGNVAAAALIFSRVEGTLSTRWTSKNGSQSVEVEARQGEGDLLAAIGDCYGIKIPTAGQDEILLRVITDENPSSAELREMKPPPPAKPSDSQLESSLRGLLASSPSPPVRNAAIGFLEELLKEKQ
jgi:hypothetical protein